MQIDPNDIQWDQQPAPRGAAIPVGRPSADKRAEAAADRAATAAERAAAAQDRAANIAANKAPVDLTKGTLDVKYAPLDQSRKLGSDYKRESAVQVYEAAIPLYSYLLKTSLRPANSLKAGMIFQTTAKILDPTTAAMQGEVDSQAAAARQQGIIADLNSRYQQYIDGGGALTEQGRRAILNEITTRMQGYNAAYLEKRREYSDLAKRYNLNPKDVVMGHAGAPFRATTDQYMAAQRKKGVVFEGDTDPTAVLASGDSRRIPDPALRGVNEAVNRMLKAGVSDTDIITYMSSRGLKPGDTTAEKTMQFRRENPNYKGEYLIDIETKPEPVPKAQQIFNKAANSEVGAAVINAGDTLTAGIPSAIMGRQGVDAVSQDNQAGATIGQVVGGGVGAMGVGKLAIAALPRFSPAIAGITGDTIYSAASGAGTAQDGNRFSGAMLGIAGGLAGETIGRKVIAPVARGFSNSPAGRMMRSKMGIGDTATPITGNGGAGATPPSGGGGSPSIERPGIGDLIIGQNLGKDTTPQQVADSIRYAQDLARRQGIEPVNVLADVNPSLRRLAGSSTRRSPDAFTMAESFLDPRSMGQIDRYQAGLEKTLGKTGNLVDAAEGLTARARAEARPLYEAAYAREGASNAYEKVKGLFTRGPMKDALRQAYKIADADGVDPTTLGFQLSDTGEVILDRVPSWQTMDYVKRGLDDLVEGFRDKTTMQLNLDAYGTAVDRMRKQYVGTLRHYNPEYKQALATYSDRAGQRDALEAGKKAISANPDNIEVRMRRASPSQMAQAQLGYRSALEDQAQNVQFSSDPFRATLGKPVQQRRMGLMYPDLQPDNNLLLQQMPIERSFGKTANEILGGSATQGRARADEAFDLSPGAQFASDVGNDAINGQGILASLIRRGSQYAQDVSRLGVGVKKADAVAPQLFDPSINPDEFLVRQTAVQDYLRQKSTQNQQGAWLAQALAAPIYGGN